MFIGREAEARLLLNNIDKGHASLLIGEAGMGKSALLEFICSVAKQERTVIYTTRVAPFGSFLKELYAGLWETRLVARQTDVDTDFKSWKKQHGTNDEKAKALLQVLEQHPHTVLIIDDAGGVTPSSRPWLELISGAVTMLAAIEPLALKKRGSKRFWKRFDEVTLGRLSKDEARGILDSLITRYKVVTDEPEVYRRKVLELAQGSPFELTRLVKYHSTEALVKTQALSVYTERLVERDVKGVALAPLLLIAGAFTVAARYVARAQGDLDLYVLSGIGIGVMLVFGPFLRSALKPRSQ